MGKLDSVALVWIGKSQSGIIGLRRVSMDWRATVWEVGLSRISMGRLTQSGKVGLSRVRMGWLAPVWESWTHSGWHELANPSLGKLDSVWLVWIGGPQSGNLDSVG